MLLVPHNYSWVITWLLGTVAPSHTRSESSTAQECATLPQHHVWAGIEVSHCKSRAIFYLLASRKTSVPIIYLEVSSNYFTVDLGKAYSWSCLSLNLSKA